MEGRKMTMGVLDDLIKIKTAKQEDDLLKLLDEIPIYEKLSVDKNLADLKNSDVTRKRCPLLAGFKDGKLYEILLADLAANVYLQIENRIPDVLMSAVNFSAKQERQKEVLKHGITRIEYRDITEYDHDELSALVAGVFTKREGTACTIAIVVKMPDGYVMYHGCYMGDKTEKDGTVKNNPIIIRGSKGIFTMNNYSMLGNNAYRFGTYSCMNGTYDVMLGMEGELYLMNGEQPMVYELSHALMNRIHMAKSDPRLFAEAITIALESVVE